MNGVLHASALRGGLVFVVSRFEGNQVSGVEKNGIHSGEP
jgi:hypothetical protein